MTALPDLDRPAPAAARIRWRCLARSAVVAATAMLDACGGGGNGSDASASAPVQAAPAITAQPAAVSVTAGGDATFAAAASGTPAPTVQWQKSSDGGATWADIAGATNASETLTAVGAGDDGTRYRAVFSNAAGSATSSEATLSVVAAGAVEVEVGLNAPFGVAVDDSGNLYIADTFNHVIRKVTPAGAATVLAGQVGVRGNVDANGGAARFDVPQALALDASGNVYVADAANWAIRKISPGGDVTTLAGHSRPSCEAGLDGTGSAASFLFPTGVAVDAEGNVFVSENNAHAIRMIRPTGETSTLAGSVAHQGNADGFGNAATFMLPAGIAVHRASGNIFLLDQTDVRFVTPTGNVTLLAGAPNQLGSVDGPNGTARFHEPEGIAVDAGGNLAIADTENFTIRRITNGDVVTTLAGSVNTLGSADGACATALFNRPGGVGFDAAGNLYVADTDNNLIRKIVIGPPCVVSTVVK